MHWGYLEGYREVRGLEREGQQGGKGRERVRRRERGNREGKSERGLDRERGATGRQRE